jgi:hypothetical protein
MRAFSVSYNPGIDQTKITFSSEFETADWITKMDILQDAIVDLEDVYEETRKQMTAMYAPKAAKPAEENLT